jgi:glutathione S-transferase
MHAHARVQVCLEEIDEMLEEYDDGPFLTGKSISAADVYWAPFLERLAAQVPVFYPTLAPRTLKGSRFEALSEWYDAMDEEVPCYASRVKGRAEVLQARLADEPWLEDKVAESSAVVVPDLPPRRGFNADAVWAR